MSELNMKGSFELKPEEIDRVVPKETCGNYALGYRHDGKFHVRYVGRSDSDLRDRLKAHVKEDKEYERFMFSICSSADEAFKEECRNYHDFGGDKGQLKNDKHPRNPEGKTYKCPYCDKLDKE